MASVRTHSRLVAAAIAVTTAVVLPVSTATAATPELGQPCSGAESGRKVTDSKGRTIMCTNYRWQIYNGQRQSGQLFGNRGIDFG